MPGIQNLAKIIPSPSLISSYPGLGDPEPPPEPYAAPDPVLENLTKLCMSLEHQEKKEEPTLEVWCWGCTINKVL